MSIAISEIVSYEKSYRIDILNPKTKKKIGLTFWVKHIDCADSTSVLRGNSLSQTILAQRPANREFDYLAACVTGWDWEGQEFESGKGVLEFSRENVSYVLHHPSASWITAAVLRGASDIANFTNV